MSLFAIVQLSETHVSCKIKGIRGLSEAHLRARNSIYLSTITYINYYNFRECASEISKAITNQCPINKWHSPPKIYIARTTSLHPHIKIKKFLFPQSLEFYSRMTHYHLIIKHLSEGTFPSALYGKINRFGNVSGDGLPLPSATIPSRGKSNPAADIPSMSVILLPFGCCQLSCAPFGGYFIGLICFHIGEVAELHTFIEIILHDKWYLRNR